MRHALLGLLTLALVGCSTPEFNAAEATCRAEWLKKIPPNYQQMLVNRTRYIQQPSGQVSCTTFGSYTSCNQQMISVPIPYTAVETVDVNDGRRDPQISSCTASRCIQTYGNAECKPA
jgi:hypothetical protein